MVPIRKGLKSNYFDKHIFYNIKMLSTARHASVVLKSFISEVPSL